MSFPRDLLDQAWHLSRKEPRRPRQASLRRAVSAAYYAVFHLVVEEGSRTLATGTAFPAARYLLARAFKHSEMNSASKAFANGNLPKQIQAAVGPVIVPPELSSFAEAFVELQQARHEADYNLQNAWTRAMTQEYIIRAEQAFNDWDIIRSQQVTRLYLIASFALKKFRG